MKRIIALLFILIVTVSAMVCPCYANEKGDSLTEEEKAFIE